MQNKAVHKCWIFPAQALSCTSKCMWIYVSLMKMYLKMPSVKWQLFCLSNFAWTSYGNWAPMIKIQSSLNQNVNIFFEVNPFANVYAITVKTNTMASQITGILTVCSILCSGAHQRKCQSSASLAFVRGIHQSPADSPHKGPVMQELFPVDDVIMPTLKYWGLNNLIDILKCILIYENFCFKFHRNLLLGVKLLIIQHRFR